MKRIVNYTGFTLVEIMTVVVICGAIVGVAIPLYINVRERFIASEGEKILLTIYASQKRQMLDTNSYTANLADLDVDIPNNTPYYPQIWARVGNHDPAVVGAVQRPQDKNYGLYIQETGEILCYHPTSGNALCEKLGYTLTAFQPY